MKKRTQTRKPVPTPISDVWDDVQTYMLGDVVDWTHGGEGMTPCRQRVRLDRRTNLVLFNKEWETYHAIRSFVRSLWLATEFSGFFPEADPVPHQGSDPIPSE